MIWILLTDPVPLIRIKYHITIPDPGGHLLRIQRIRIQNTDIGRYPLDNNIIVIF
jgi:hypothetical protein